MSLAAPAIVKSRFAPVAALDPRVRLLALLALLAAIVSLQTWTMRLFVLFVGVALVAATDISWGKALRRLAHVEGFMIALLILLPLTVGGDALAQIGPFAISERGVMRAAQIVLTVNAAALCALALVGTLQPIRLGRAMAALGAPDRFVQLFMFIVRYHSLFTDEIARQFEILRARGFSPRLSRHTFRSYGTLAGMILIGSIERAERVSEAMACRGSNGRLPLRRTRAMTPSDMAFLIVALCCAAGFVIADRII